MARPNRLNFATGPAGKKRFVEALRIWQDKQKALKEKAAAKKSAPKKPVAKEPVTKKPVTKSKSTTTSTSKSKTKTTPTTKSNTKSTPKRGTGAKKSTPTTKSNTKSTPKRGTGAKKSTPNTKSQPTANQRLKATGKGLKEIADKATKEGKKAVDTVGKKVGETKGKIAKALDKPSPTKRPTTRLQKLASKGNKALKASSKYVKGPLAKNVGSKLKAIGKGIAKDPKSVLKGAKGAGASILAEKLSTALVNRASNAVFGKERIKKGKAKLADVRKNPDKYERTALGYRLKGTGPKKESSSPKKSLYAKYGDRLKNISDKFKNRNTKTTTNTDKTKNNKKSTSKDLKINKSSDYLKKTNLPSSEGGKYVKAPKKRLTGREKLRQKNIDRFGKPHVDKLRQKNKDFQAMKRKKMSKEEFRKKYPNSITAQRHKGLRK